MGVEVERKFLVESEAWRSDADGGTVLAQGYLSDHPDRVVRVRLAGDQGTLTIKGRGEDPAVRPEFEYPVPIDDALALLAMCPTSLTKRRHRAPAGGTLTWEIDVFEGRHAGLVLAEIELPSPDTLFDRPAWLGPEVTDDPSYSNAAIAQR